jgi:hypothetical protein
VGARAHPSPPHLERSGCVSNPTFRERIDVARANARAASITIEVPREAYYSRG